ncbi:MAG: hypothetical protein DRJ56_05795 [Thermoprotei archaeon]|nr:MAG: hypothetical protein DRJ56_05795 [Thermoprotei archaeon]
MSGARGVPAPNDPSFIVEFNARIKRMYSDYSKAVSESRYERAVEVGTSILRDLLDVARNVVAASLRSPEARRIVEDIIACHEKYLGYVEGVREAVSELPPLYTFEARERAIDTLSSSIQELFSFILGALVVIADLQSDAPRPSGGGEDGAGFV